jgi:FlaG/FlaF family flagellin (archaellin)
MKRLVIVITVALAACIFSCNPSKTTTNSAPTDTTNTMKTDTSTNMNNTDTTHHR